MEIPDGNGPDEIRQILESVANRISEGADLTLDVTQGFRHFPLSKNKKGGLCSEKERAMFFTTFAYREICTNRMRESSHWLLHHKSAVSPKKGLTVCRVSSKIVDISFLCAKADRKIVTPHREVGTLKSRALSQFIMFFYDLCAYGKSSRAE